MDKFTPGSAILVGNDYFALGLYKALTEAGLRIPDDVEVFGYGNHPFSAYMQPPLSTMALPAEAIGSAAVTLLIQRIDATAPTEEAAHRNQACGDDHAGVDTPARRRRRHRRGGLVKVFIAKRIWQTLILIFGAVTVVFMVLRAIPGDPALLMVGANATPAEVAQVRVEMGLTEPLWIQYIQNVGRAAGQLR